MPSPFEDSSRSTPVCVLSAVILAPLTAAPELSVTMPVMLPLCSSWAAAKRALKKTARDARSTRLRALALMVCCI